MSIRIVDKMPSLCPNCKKMVRFQHSHKKDPKDPYPFCPNCGWIKVPSKSEDQLQDKERFQEMTNMSEVWQSPEVEGKLTGVSPEKIFATFPSKIGNYFAGPIRTYGAKELGASIGYNSEERTTITIYLYDQGIPVIPDGINSEIIERSMKMAMEDIVKLGEAGRWKNFVKMLEQEVVFNIGIKSLKALYASYSGISVTPGESRAVISGVYVTGIINYICKIRITRPSDTDEVESRGVVQVLLAQLDK